MELALAQGVREKAKFPYAEGFFYFLIFRNSHIYSHFFPHIDSLMEYEWHDSHRKHLNWISWVKIGINNCRRRRHFEAFITFFLLLIALLSVVVVVVRLFSTIHTVASWMKNIAVQSPIIDCIFFRFCLIDHWCLQRAQESVQGITRLTKSGAQAIVRSIKKIFPYDFQCPFQHVPWTHRKFDFYQ